MKHLKSFIIGVIVGALVFSGLSVIAQQYSIVPNPFNVIFNGEKIHIEGYNINNSTYFKLKDIGDRIGFDVDFVDNQIHISTNGGAKQMSSADEISKPNKYTAIVNGETYYRPVIFGTSDIENLPSDWLYYNFFTSYDTESRKWNIYTDRSKEQLIISFNADKTIDGESYISKSYCDEYIIPAIEAYLDSVE